jgi:hypothetical protein
VCRLRSSAYRCLLSSDVGAFGPRFIRSAQQMLGGNARKREAYGHGSAGMIVVDRNYDGGLGLAQPANNSQMLSHAEAMRLLASVDYGRVVFTQNALPAVRPVNHLMDEGRIIIRTRLTTAISSVVASADAGVVVAYEADDFDSQSQSGWSVVATGWAHRVNDLGQVSRYERLLHAWVNHADTVLAIEPHIVTGFHIIASER